MQCAPHSQVAGAMTLQKAYGLSRQSATRADRPMISCKAASTGAIPVFLEGLFELPVERWIAWTRLGLSGSALLASLVDPLHDTSWSSAARLSLSAYFIYAAMLVLTSRRSRQGPGLQYATHGTDIAMSSALLYATNGPATPFFAFFVFVNLSAALQWGWRGVAATTGMLAFLSVALAVAGLHRETPQGGSPGASDDLGSGLIRGAFLLVSGALLAYVGAFQERSRARFAQLGAWPSSASAQSHDESLAAVLAHAARVIGAPRILVVWEQPDEPFVNVDHWAEGKLHSSRERAGTFGRLVAPSYRDKSFIVATARAKRQQAADEDKPAAVLDRALVRAFAIESTVTAAFEQANCTGRVFVLDCDHWSEDHLALVEIIASRIGIELDDRFLRTAVEQAASERERSRVARDLHDGVLQGLAAASMQLKIASDRLPREAQTQLAEVRNLLVSEAQRVRQFVEKTRVLRLREGGGVVQIKPQLEKCVRRLRDQWRCDISLDVERDDISISFSVANDIEHILAEAVSNAVRHGKATELEIAVKQAQQCLIIQIRDNGQGFEGLAGSYREAELDEQNLGPLSLRSRVNDLTGSLFLTSSPHGTDIRIEVPYES
jgi:signal transduction histidine kinase